MRSPLTFAQRLTIRIHLSQSRLREYLTFDSWLAGLAASWGALGAAFGFWLLGNYRKALALLTAAHRTNRSSVARNLVERILRVPPPGVTSRLSTEVEKAYAIYLGSVTAGAKHLRAENLIGHRLLVLKSSREHERGVIVIDYTYSFPLIARFCDLHALSQRYYVLLEPSWIGYCTPEILVYSRLGEPVFVQTIEQPDAAFLGSVSRHFVHVLTTGNWWVDHRLIRPSPQVTKDVDVSMVAAWSGYKRHAHFFAALGRLRRKGVSLNVQLIGYAVDGTMTRDDIYRQAQYYGVADTLEILEHLTPQEVSQNVSRSKVNVLWSRREGSNRAIIEAMLTDVPVILRAAHNYGQPYAFINPSTGRFADESSLPDVLLDVIERFQEFAPRQWILENMTPQIATRVINERIKAVASDRGERWTEDLVMKTVQLNGMHYWNAEDGARFESDYAYVRSLLRD